MRTAPWRNCLLFIAVVVIGAGCGESGPKKYRVTGTVKWKGEPVKLGSISFRSLDGANSGSGTIVNGQYDLSEKAGLVPGKYVVAISYPDPKGKRPEPDEEAPGESDATAPRNLIPPKYNTNSELTAEIKAEPNEINFDLPGK